MANGERFRNPHWQSETACTTDDAERLFFVQFPSKEVKKERKNMCLNCPVRLECLEDDAANGPAKRDDISGYRGGLSAEERKGYKRQATIDKLKIERNIF